MSRVKCTTIDNIFKLLLFRQHKTHQAKEKALVKQLKELGWLEFMILCNAISKILITAPKKKTRRNQ